MEGAGRANGLYFDAEGYLIACADDHNQLLRIAPDKTVEVLLREVDGNRFNGPNDAWVVPGGGIYFTDPYYQRDWWSRTEPELESQNVYYLSPQGELSVADGMTLDAAGNLYLTGDGVTVFDASGQQVEHIPIEEAWTANVTFGGPERDLLFITAMDSVYRLRMAVQGAR